MALLPYSVRYTTGAGSGSTSGVAATAARQAAFTVSVGAS